MSNPKYSSNPPILLLVVEDYINYFFPGLFWIGVTILGTYFFMPDNLNSTFESIGRLNNIILLGLVTVCPYLIGLSLSFLTRIIHYLDRSLFGIPEQYVVNKNLKKKFLGRSIGNALGKSLTLEILNSIKEVFGFDIPKGSMYFTVRSSLDLVQNQNIQFSIARLTNLMNLYEAIIFPMFFALVLSSIHYINTMNLPLLFLILLLAILIGGSWYRYRKFRENRAKRVFRYFYLIHGLSWD